VLTVASTCPACRSACPPVNTYIAYCGSCGHRWLGNSAEEHTGVEDRTYTRDYDGYRPDEKFVAIATAITREELSTRVPPPGRVLDVGCGAGDFMMIAKASGYDVQGIDISEASAEICRERKLDVCTGDFRTREFDGEFDLITMWDVVEHLRDPAAFFERAGSLLSKRGYVFAKIPAFGRLSVSLSNYWPRAGGILLGAPSHVQYFSRESLSTLLRRLGFGTEWISGAGARSRPATGSLRRSLILGARDLIKTASGDANLYLVARPLS
jgi:SAM-dependent methyltransferase